MNIEYMNMQVAHQLIEDDRVSEEVKETLSEKLARQRERTVDLHQRLSVIDSLEHEIAHFTNALETVRALPSSVDMGMPEAYAAYQRLMNSYSEMIKVRQEIIDRLRSSSMSTTQSRSTTHDQ